MPQQKQKLEGLDISHNITETAQLIDLDELNKYEKKVRKTVLLYYGDNGLERAQDVADELGVSRETVSRRLNSDEAKDFMKMFSHKDKDELDRWFEKLAASHYDKAMQGLRLAVKNASKREDVSPQVLKSCSMALLKADEQLAKNLQEFGAIQKPKERKEVENKGDTTEHRKELAQLMKEKQEGEEQDD